MAATKDSANNCLITVFQASAVFQKIEKLT